MYPAVVGHSDHDLQNSSVTKKNSVEAVAGRGVGHVCLAHFQC